MIFVLAEDRTDHEPALDVAVRSVLTFEPMARIVLYTNNLSEAFLSKIAKLENVEIRGYPPDASNGWSIKASVLIHSLSINRDEVVWIDSDIVLNRSISVELDKFASGSLVVAEEALAGQIRDDRKAYRARAWGFEIGRHLPYVTNTCVMRCDRSHLSLLEAWRDAMKDRRYVEAQSIPFHKRPPHLGGDQDVLTAILSAAHFEHIDVGYLRRGKHIIQYYGPYGFTTLERARASLLGMPTIVHSQAFKPWLDRPLVKGARNDRYLFRLLMDTSPYNSSARAALEAAGLKAEWLRCRTILGKLLTVSGFNYAPLTGLPLALLGDFIFSFKKIRRSISDRLART